MVPDRVPGRLRWLLGGSVAIHGSSLHEELRVPRGGFPARPRSLESAAD